MPPVKLTWYDGGLTPPKPEEIGDENLNGEGGILYIGSKGKMLQDTYGLNPRLLPDSQACVDAAAETAPAAHPARGARDELGGRDPRPARKSRARSSTPRS